MPNRYTTMIIDVHVKPNSRSNELAYDGSGMLKARIASVPEAGKANEHLIRLLSAFFHIPQKNIQIIKGHKSRRKSVKIELGDEEVMKKLRELIKET